VPSKQIEGLDELKNKLKKLSNLDQGRALRAAAGGYGQEVVKNARRFIPRGTEIHTTYKGRVVGPGFASRSIRKRVSLSRDKDRAYVTIGVAPEAFYATQFVELGKDKRHKMAKRPWLVPAFEASEASGMSRFKARMRKAIDKASK
jgi:hypothetical protein